MCDQQHISAAQLLLAVDGGGTKAEFVLFTADGNIRKRFQLPGTNVSVYGFEQVVQTLRQGIDLCLQEQGMLTDVFIGTAGSQLLKLQQTLSAAYPKLRIAVESDGVNALYLENAEAALICGTGSILVLKEKQGIRRVGGWGYRLGDPGSGFLFGHKLLQLCADHEDGIADHGPLFEKMCQKLSCSTLRDVLRFLEPPRIASLAPILLDAYKEGNREVAGIVCCEMERLGKLVSASCAPGSRVILCGGMFGHYADQLLPVLQSYTQEGISYLLPTLPPIYGACVRCCELAGISCPAHHLKEALQ